MACLEFVMLGLVFKMTYEHSSKISIISYERERSFLSLKGCSVEAAGEGMGKVECGLRWCCFFILKYIMSSPDYFFCVLPFFLLSA